MTETVMPDRFATDLSYLQSVEVTVDADQNISYRPGPGGSVQFTVHPSLRTAAGGCAGPVAGAASVPALLGLSILAPLLNPTAWGRFSSISTRQPLTATTPCPDQQHGWVGSIVESGSVAICGTHYAFENQLDMSFCYSAEQSQARWTLGRCLAGGFTSDSGTFTAVPDPSCPSDWSAVTAAKTVNWDNQQPVCRIPTELRQQLLEIFIRIGLIEYVLNAFVFVETQGTPEQQAALALAYEQYWAEYVKAVRAAGYDLEEHRLLPARAA